MKPEARAQCEECLSRREFLAKSAVAAAVVVVAVGCGNGQFGPTPFTAPNARGSGSNANIFVVGSYPALATAGTLVMVDSYRAVKRTGAQTFAAYSMICTHQGCLTALSNNTFYCPCHGAQFDSSGHVIRGPAPSPLATIATSYDPTTDQLTLG